MSFTPSFIIQICAILLALLGFITLFFGLRVLARYAFSKDMNEVSKEVTRLAKKGILSDVGSSMQSASFLVQQLTEQIKTARGIGLTLIFIGLVMIAGGVALLKNLI